MICLLFLGSIHAILKEGVAGRLLIAVNTGIEFSFSIGSSAILFVALFLQFSAGNDILCVQFFTTIRGMTFHGREENGRSGG